MLFITLFIPTVLLSQDLVFAKDSDWEGIEQAAVAAGLLKTN